MGSYYYEADTPLRLSQSCRELSFADEMVVSTAAFDDWLFLAECLLKLSAAATIRDELLRELF